MSKRSIVHKYLLIKIRKGDTESFSKLYDELAPRVYRFVLFKVDSREEAEDITSQVFLKTWNYVQDADEEIKSLRAFIYRIARNLVIDYYRTKAQTVHSAVIDMQEAVLTELVDETMREGIEREQDMQILFSTLRGLKEEYREIILLRYVDDLTTSEISQILNKKQSAVRTQLSRAMTALKELVSQENLL